jgi:hypothetical protein
LLPVANVEQIIERTRAEQAAQAPDYTPVVSSLANHVRTAWERNKRVKIDKEREFLKALRQRKGEYEPEVMSEIREFGGSEVFVKVTDTKCVAAVSWIRDVLSMERPWELEPTVEPDIPPEMQAQIQSQVQAQVLGQLQQALAMGMQVAPEQVEQAYSQGVEQTADAVKKQIEKLARQEAAKASDHIEDIMQEGGFDSALADAIEDLITYGVAILKGPIQRRRTVLEWVNGQAVAQEKIVREYEQVSPFDLYPSASAVECDHGELIERYRLEQTDLEAFRGVDGYDSDAIERILTQYEKDGLKEWMWTDSDRDRLDNRFTQNTDTDTLDAIIYHGHVPGRMLIEWGMDAAAIPDPIKRYAAECWMIGTEVFRAVLNDDPLGRRPYSKAVLRILPGSFWGNGGVPKMMDGLQQEVNVVERSLNNNVAIASGPLVAMWGEPLGEKPDEIWPWKVQRFEDTHAMAGGSQQPPIAFFQPQMHAQELIQVKESLLRSIDEVTGIPAYVQGNDQARGATNTASGLSMLMNAASKGIKLIIMAIDRGLIPPTVDRTYFDLMQAGEMPGYQGDAHAVSKGAVKLLVKEQNLVRRMEFLQQTNNPVDIQIMGYPRRAQLLRGLGENLSVDPDDVAPTREEMERQMASASQAQAQMQPQQPPQRAQSTLNQAGEPAGATDNRLYGAGGPPPA